MKFRFEKYQRLPIIFKDLDDSRTVQGQKPDAIESNYFFSSSFFFKYRGGVLVDDKQL